MIDIISVYATILVMNKRQKVFIDDICEKLDKEFNMKQIADLKDMSRWTLWRKIKAIKGGRAKVAEHRYQYIPETIKAMREKGYYSEYFKHVNTGDEPSTETEQDGGAAYLDSLINGE